MRVAFIFQFGWAGNSSGKTRERIRKSARKNEMRSQIAVDEAVADKQACGRGLGVFSGNRLDRCKRVMLASDLRSDDAISGQQSVTNAADRLRLGLHGPDYEIQQDIGRMNRQLKAELFDPIGLPSALEKSRAHGPSYFPMIRMPRGFESFAALNRTRDLQEGKYLGLILGRPPAWGCTSDITEDYEVCGMKFSKNLQFPTFSRHAEAFSVGGLDNNFLR